MTAKMFAIVIIDWKLGIKVDEIIEHDDNLKWRQYDESTGDKSNGDNGDNCKLAIGRAVGSSIKVLRFCYNGAKALIHGDTLSCVVHYYSSLLCFVLLNNATIF